MMQLTQLHSWKALKTYSEQSQFQPMETFRQSSNVVLSNIQCNGIQLDFSKQLINTTSLDLLLQLANERHLKTKIDALMSGEKVNVSESRPALHTALRAADKSTILIDGHNIVEDVIETRQKMRDIAEKIRAQQWHGYSGKAITDIVNIGIGGSDFGPRFCIDALSQYTAADLKYHFISDADPNAFQHTVKALNQETTLFIISSKSFTTKETLYNAKKAIEWFGAIKSLDAHFIAVTANEKQAKKYGIHHVLLIWDWVGGRFSFCSAINLISCIALGFEHFMEMLKGAHDMDVHFQNTPFEKNLPVMLGLLGIWNINFLHISNLLFLVYARQLERFVPYIQQLDMESNGKSIDALNRSINYATSPIVWGGVGNQIQHSYFQLLCQGSHQVAADFISTNQFNSEMINDVCLAKMNVLSTGINAQSGGYILGGTPLNHIRLDECSPYHIGLLSALYEHKIYIQAVIWDINPFDQPGVESAKQVLFTGLSEMI